MAQRREYQGAVPATTLSGDITNFSTSITITSSTSWPTGAIGPFLIVIDKGKSNEEKVLITSRSGTTLAVSSRGADGTAAAAHSTNATIQHVLGATDIDLVNKHAADTTQDDHTQYMHVSTARTVSSANHFTATQTLDSVALGGGSLSGTFTGSPTLSGAPHFTGTPLYDHPAANVAGVDIGKISITAGTTVWTNHLEANGQSVLRADWPLLFTEIGTTYGSVDGTHFNVPDLRDRFLCAAGSTRTLQTNGGSDTVTLSTANLAAHTHTITDPGHTHTISDPGHVHTVTDPGHKHQPVDSGSYEMVISSPFTETHYIPQDPGGTGNVQVNFSYMYNATTGISVDSHTTGITGAASNTTGITATGSNGSGTPATVVPKYFAGKALIKAA